MQWSDHVANGQYQSLDPLVRPRETRVMTVADADPVRPATSNNNKKIILHVVLGVATAGIWLLVLAVVALWRRGARGWSGALATGLTLLIMAIALGDGSTSTVDASPDTTGAATQAAKQPLVATKPTAARATAKVANPKTTAKVANPKTTAKVTTKPTAKKTAPKVTTKPTAKKTTPATIRGVRPGAFCSQHGALGTTSDGTLMRCKTTASDSRYRWRKA